MHQESVVSASPTRCSGVTAAALRGRLNTQGISCSTGYLVHSIGSSENEEVPDIIRERTQAGLASARARGRMGGRPKKKKLNTPAKVAIAKALDADHSHSITDICKTVGSRATLYRCLDVPAPLAAAPTEP